MKLQAIPAIEVPLAPGITVRRLLPRSARRMVGAWCFLDVFGPLRFARGAKPMDVPPHPHCGLQTVTWLLEGEVLHKDSLDSEAVGRPGALNLMTSGHGIAHSEETPPGSAGGLHGVQLWTALPDGQREVAASFEEHPQRPQVALGGGTATVIMGELAGTVATATTFSPLVAAEVAPRAGETVAFPLRRDFEHALVPLVGTVSVEGAPLVVDTLYYVEPGCSELALRAVGEGARVLLIGGLPFGERILMWWNFVARTPDEVAAARADWQAGRRFGEVRRYDGQRLEAPKLVARPVPPNPAS
jgi:redox-sensitive bicupin YhaK (pirin superfamily)